MARTKTQQPAIDLSSILALPVKERKRIAKQILESTEDAEIEFSPEIRAELERRMALSEADPSRLIPWAVVKAELDEYCKRSAKKRV